MKLNLSVFRTMILSALLFVGVAVQARVITGTVKDPTGETIISASVVVKGTTLGTVTDFDGNYTLDVPADATVLVFSYIGMQTQELTITGDVMDVVLSENSEVLEEVVVTGYGTTKKRDVVTSVASVGADQIKDIPVTSAAEALQGKLSGVSVVTTDGSPDADVKIRVRGGSSLTQSSDPLYIVDGFPVSSISDISPNDIASMDVLKDAAATAIYGAQGANGVIIITTKETDGGEEKMAFKVDYSGYMGWREVAKRYDVMNAEDFLKMQYEFAYMSTKNAESAMNSRFYAYMDPNYNDAVGTASRSTFADIVDYWNRQTYHDYQSEIFSKGLYSNHAFTVSGGIKKANFMLSYNRVDDRSIMYGSDYVRNNLSLKAKFQPIKGMTIGFTTRFSNTKVLGSGTNSAEDSGSKSETRLRNAVAYSPIEVILPQDEDDDFGNIYPPKQAIDDNWRSKVDNKFTLNGYVQYKFLKHFTVKADLGYENRDILTDRYYGASTQYSIKGTGFTKMGAPGYGHAISTDDKYTRFKETNTFEYANKWNNAHDFSVLIGEEQTITREMLRTSMGFGFDPTLTGPQVFNLLGQSPVASVQSYQAPNDNMLSVFARANYNYKGRYYVTATFRADGSTRFAKGHQWGFFPSAAIAWRLIDEEWMESAQDVMSNFKLRLSFGSVGNNNVPLGYLNSAYLSDNNKIYMDGASVVLIDGKNGSSSETELIAANSDLTWETTVTRDLGIDFGFFNERLSGAIDLYWNNTKDLILKYELATGGYNYQYRNIGSTDNKGIDFSIKGVILDHRSKNLSYGLTVDANLSFNRNTVTDLGGLDEYKISAKCFSTYYSPTYEFMVKPGEAVGNIYGYQTNGIFTPDDFASYNKAKDQWLDANGNQIETPLGSAYPGMVKIEKNKDTDADGVMDDYQMVKLGNALPDLTGGFNIGWFVGSDKWGKVDFSANFTYSVGNDVVNLSGLDYTTMCSSTKGRNLLNSVAYDKRYSLFQMNDQTGEFEYIPASATAVKNKVEGDNYIALANRLAEANDGKVVANPYSATTTVLTDKYVEDASFLRLASLNIGYTLAEKWTKKAHISTLRFFFSASNLFCITNYSGLDPEVSTRTKINPLAIGVDFGAFPKSRGFNFGINLSFE